MTDVSMTRGDSRTVIVSDIKDSEGNSPSLSGATAWLTIKKKFSQDDDDALLQKIITGTSGNDGVIVAVGDPSTHYLQFTLEPSDTDDVASRPWRYDVQIKLADARIFTVQDGKWSFDYDVTRSTV